MFTCTFQQLQHGLSRMAPASTVPEASSSQPASSSLLLQTLMQVLPLNRCSLPSDDTKEQLLSIKEDVKNSFVTSKRQVPREDLNPRQFRFAGQTLYRLSYRALVGELGHLLGSYVTSILHTARINNVESILCGDRVRKMVISSLVDE